MNGKDALNKLIAGNKRYQEGNLEHPHQTKKGAGIWPVGRNPLRVS